MNPPDPHLSGGSSSGSGGGMHLVDEFNVHRTEKFVRLELHNEFIKIYNINPPSPPPSTTENNNNNTTNGSNQVADVILNLKDVAGSSVGKGKDEFDTKSYFTIYAYIKPKTASGESTATVKRKRKTFEFAYGKLPTYNENFVHVNKWHLKLYNLLRLKTFIHQQRLMNETNAAAATASSAVTSDSVMPTTSTNSDANHQQHAHREIVLAKPFLVFVNPKSGSGKAKNIYFERALPVWAEANIPDTAVFTRNLISIHLLDNLKIKGIIFCRFLIEFFVYI